MNQPNRRQILQFGLATFAVGLQACGGSAAEAVPENSPLAPPPPAAPPPAAPVTIPTPSVPAGAWQALSFPATMRRPIGSPSGASKVTFDPTPSLAVESVAPVSTNVVPFRGFCRATMGEPGVLYYHGSLHSDYSGNEIDRIDITDLSSTSVDVRINHQPNVPPWGVESGYGSGSGSYLYRQYGTGLAPGENWQPYAFHNWCFNTWHPEHGYLLYTNYAVENGATKGADPAGNGTAFVQSSKLFYATYRDYRQVGFVRYYKNSRYELATLQPKETLPGAPAGVSNYSAYRQSLFAFYCDSYRLDIYELANGAWIANGSQSVAEFSAGIDNNHWPYSKDGNGLLALCLDTNKVLLYTTNGPAWGAKATTLNRFNYDHQVYVYDAELKSMTRVILPLNIVNALSSYTSSGDGLITFAVDRASREIYCAAVDGPSVDGMHVGPLLIWVASFDDLATWAPVSHTGCPTVSANFAIDREPLKVYNGFLFFMSKSGNGVRLDRVKVSQGEVAPRFVFHRQDYVTQNFALASPHSGGVLVAKHCNQAYRAVDDRYYQMAGDIIESFTQSMYSVHVSPSGYSFATELNETNPAPTGYVRPASPDDGAWAYCGGGNANARLADKFIWMRGGDGAGYRSNGLMQSAYPDDAAVIADRWTLKKSYIYDPVNKRFSDGGIEAWPVDKGSDPVSHPGTWPSSYCRNGAFDKKTNTFFRFAPDRLVAFNFDTQRIRIWNCAWWRRSVDVSVRMEGYVPKSGAVDFIADAEFPNMYYAADGRYHTHGQFEWEHQATWLDESTGKLYVVSYATGYLWCFETRGVETADRDGNLTIPFYPVGARIPFENHFANIAGVDAMHSYLVPFKGGLFYTIDTPGGNSGAARYAYWRRLGFTGAWTPITLPVDWGCNTFGAKFPGDINNDEFLGIGAAPMARNNSSRTGAFYLVR